MFHIRTLPRVPYGTTVVSCHTFRTRDVHVTYTYTMFACLPFWSIVPTFSPRTFLLPPGCLFQTVLACVVYTLQTHVRKCMVPMSHVYVRNMARTHTLARTHPMHTRAPNTRTRARTRASFRTRLRTMVRTQECNTPLEEKKKRNTHQPVCNFEWAWVCASNESATSSSIAFTDLAGGTGMEP
jgi:hypothetical protein